MPISNIALAQILADRIVALGAVPVTTNLQAEDAENLLWNQLLSLITGDLDFAGQRVFVGSSNVANSLGVTLFPGVTSVPLTDVNFPVGAIANVNMSGTLANTSGGAFAMAVGFNLGAAISAPGISVGGAVALAFWSFSARVARFTNTLVKLLSVNYAINTLPVEVTLDSGVPSRAFASGNAIAPFANMAVAALTGSMMLESFSVSVERYPIITT